MKKMVVVSLVCAVTFAAIFPAIDTVECKELPPVIRYSLFLGTLDKKNRESIPKALNEFILSFGDADEKNAADAHRLFRAFYSEAAKTLNATSLGNGLGDNGNSYHREMISSLQDIVSRVGSVNICEMHLRGIMAMYDRMDDGTRSSLKSSHSSAFEELEAFERCGLDVFQGEMGFFFRESPVFLRRAAEILTGDYGDYAKYMADEGEDRIFVEGALQISWNSLRGRIIRMEDFAGEHPGLPETDNVIRPLLKTCLRYYLCGNINTWAYDPSGAIDPELLTSYERFISENTGSSYHSLISRVYGVLKKNGFTKNNELTGLLASEGYRFPARYAHD